MSPSNDPAGVDLRDPQPAISTDQGSPAMSEQSERMHEFAREVNAMKLKGASAESEQRNVVLGVVALVVPVVLAVLGIVLVMSTSDAADQRAFASQTFWLGNIVVVVGAAVFLRFSLGRFLRFWMVRLIHEQRTQTDRIVAAIERASEPVE